MLPHNASNTRELLANLAEKFSDRIAFSDGVEQLTFAELWRAVLCLAGALDAADVEAGERVAIIAANSIAWSLWEYAAQAIGAVPVGIGVQWSAEQIKHALAGCDASVLVVQDADSLARIGASVQCYKLTCLLESSQATLGGSGCYVHDELMAHPTSVALPRIHGQEPATIIFTSGSTGLPKGIMHTHARLLAAVDAIVDLFPGLAGGRVALSWMPMEHLFQRIMNLVALTFGIETRILPDAKSLVSSACELKPVFLAGVPLVYEQLLAAIEREPRRFEPWRNELHALFVGSAPTAPTMLERFWALGYPILQAYSTSECIVPIAANTMQAHRIGSVGKPLSSYSMRFSSEGEIAVRGPGTFSGYLGQHLHDRCLDDDGYFRTGDFGYLDEDGFLFIHGRGDDFFKTASGQKVAPFEVESAYKSCDLVEQIVVFGSAQGHVIAVVQVNMDAASRIARELHIDSSEFAALANDLRVQATALAELRKHETALAPYKRVRAVVLAERQFSIATGELTATGKLRRDVIAQRYGAQLAASSAQLDACVKGNRNAA